MQLLSEEYSLASALADSGTASSERSDPTSATGHEHTGPLLPDYNTTSHAFESTTHSFSDTPSAVPQTSITVTLSVIDIYTLTTSVTVTRPTTSTSIVSDIARQGYLAVSPSQPGRAVSFKTLELFRRLRLRKASMSIEAFAKVICDFYMVSYIILISFRWLIGSRSRISINIEAFSAMPLMST